MFLIGPSGPLKRHLAMMYCVSEHTEKPVQFGWYWSTIFKEVPEVTYYINDMLRDYQVGWVIQELRDTMTRFHCITYAFM